MKFKLLLLLTITCTFVISCGDGSDSYSNSGAPDTTNTYTSLATPLLNYIAADQAVTTSTASTVNTSIILGADYFATTPSIMTANYGFEGYMGVPNLNGTDSAAQAAAYAGNISFENIDPSLQAPSRAYYSASSTQSVSAIYGIDATAGDTIPVVFSHPIWPPCARPRWRSSRRDHA